MKRLKVLFIVGVMVISLVGCSGKKDSSPETETSTEESNVVTDDATDKVVEDEESKTEDFTYRSRSDGEIEIDGYNGTASRIVIPEEIDGFKVVAVSGFQGNNDITYLSIPATVKTIEKDAFYDCDNLAQVDFSDGLESIGEEAFCCCTSLKDFNMPDTVTTIGESVLSGSAVESIHISTGLETLSAYCFSMCENLSGSIEIPSNIKAIEDYAFGNDTALTEVIIGSNVETLGTESFGDCFGLTKVVVPSSVTEIGAAFRGDTDVTLYVESGSYAESFAIENEMKYEVQ